MPSFNPISQPRKHTDQETPHGLIDTAFWSVKQFGFLGTLARVCLMQSEKNKFMKADFKEISRQERKKLVSTFTAIQKDIPCAHPPGQFLFIAKMLFNLDVPGPIVECGSYRGAGSAKLSLLAKMTGRELYVCDSFCGLPAPQSTEETSLEGHDWNHPGYLFAEGEYAATLEEVKQNIEKYGCIDNCHFIPGFFADTLSQLNIEPACVMIDVDLISSALDCLKYLWPKTKRGGIWFTHEAGLPKYIYGITDFQWWQKTLKEPPPVILGAGSGLSEAIPSLAYFIKKR